MKCRFCQRPKQASYIMCDCDASLADRRARTAALQVKRAQAPAKPAQAQALTRARKHGRAGS